MSSITFASLETTVGHVFQAACHFVVNAAQKVASFVAAEAPIAEAVVAAVAPQYAAAAAATVAVINAVDAAVLDAANHTSAGVSVTLPATLVADYQAARAAILSFEKAL